MRMLLLYLLLCALSLLEIGMFRASVDLEYVGFVYQSYSHQLYKHSISELVTGYVKRLPCLMHTSFVAVLKSKLEAKLFLLCSLLCYTT